VGASEAKPWRRNTRTSRTGRQLYNIPCCIAKHVSVEPFAKTPGGVCLTTEHKKRAAQSCFHQTCTVCSSQIGSQQLLYNNCRQLPMRNETKTNSLPGLSLSKCLLLVATSSSGWFMWSYPSGSPNPFPSRAPHHRELPPSPVTHTHMLWMVCSFAVGSSR